MATETGRWWAQVLLIVAYQPLLLLFIAGLYGNMKHSAPTASSSFTTSGELELPSIPVVNISNINPMLENKKCNVPDISRIEVEVETGKEKEEK